MSLWTMVVLVVLIGTTFTAIITIVEKRGNIKLEEMKAVNSRIEGLNIEGLNNNDNEEMLKALSAENAALKAELSEIKTIVSSIEKMMKEIE